MSQITAQEIVDAQEKNDQELIQDFFEAYEIKYCHLNREELTQILTQLQQSKRTFSFLREAVFSNRYPYTIMIIAAKIGMYVPPRKRIGISAYEFFVENVKYYEETFDRDGKVPSIYDMSMSEDRISLLSRLRDDEILQPGYKFSRNYSTRPEMINNFIQNNIEIHGKFKLESTSQSVYSSRAKVISYEDPTIKLKYSTSDLLSLIDVGRKTVWRDSQSGTTFSRMALHHLRQQILRRISQWKQRDGYLQSEGSPELSAILSKLEMIVNSDPRNEISAYLI